MSGVERDMARHNSGTAGASHPAVFTPLQMRFLRVPQAPLCYWLRE